MTMTVNAGPGDQSDHLNGPDAEYREPVKRQPSSEYSAPFRVKKRPFSRGPILIDLPDLGIGAELQQAIRTVKRAEHEIERVLMPMRDIAESDEYIERFMRGGLQ